MSRIAEPGPPRPGLLTIARLSDPRKLMLKSNGTSGNVETTGWRDTSPRLLTANAYNRPGLVPLPGTVTNRALEEGLKTISRAVMKGPAPPGGGGEGCACGSSRTGPREASPCRRETEKQITLAGEPPLTAQAAGKYFSTRTWPWGSNALPMLYLGE